MKKIFNIKGYTILTIFSLFILFSCNEDDDSKYDYLIQQSNLKISSLNKTEGFFGDEILINGTGFSASPQANLVTFNGTRATVVSSTETRITAIVPFPSSSGNVNVTVNREEAPGPVFNLVLPPAELIAYTSFEEVPTFIGDYLYPKSGTEVLDNIQVSNPLADDPYVDFTANGQELGFDSSFISSDIGDSGNERMGVFVNGNLDTRPGDFDARFQDGSQGFITSDLDGTIEIVFDQVNLTDRMVNVTVEADIYFGDSTYETGDGIFIYYQVDGQLGEPLISYENDEVDANIGSWIHASGAVSLDKVKPGKIVVRMKNGTNSEMIFIDRIEIKGVTVP